jgi:TorA maturation chaperone TorD
MSELRPLSVEAGDAGRAEIYLLLGTLLFAPPDDPILDMLQEIDAGDAEPTPMTQIWRSLQAAARQTDPEQLSDEFFNLFIGLGRGELVPYASYYLHGFLMEKVLASLRNELKTLGFERREGVSEPEDHIAALCETMGMIISESGLSYEEQSDFFRTYLAGWAMDFFTDLREAESAVFYKAVAQLGQQFMEIESQYLSMPA